MNSLFNRLSIWDKIIVSFRTGLKHYPLIWFGFCHIFVAFPLVIYTCERDRKSKKMVLSRFKNNYTVVRPDDFRLAYSPKEYITDKHLLKPGHPEKVEDITAKTLTSEFRRGFYN